MLTMVLNWVISGVNVGTCWDMLGFVPVPWCWKMRTMVQIHLENWLIYGLDLGKCCHSYSSTIGPWFSPYGKPGNRTADSPHLDALVEDTYQVFESCFADTACVNDKNMPNLGLRKKGVDENHGGNYAI